MMESVNIFRRTENDNHIFNEPFIKNFKSYRKNRWNCIVEQTHLTLKDFNIWLGILNKDCYWKFN